MGTPERPRCLKKDRWEMSAKRQTSLLGIGQIFALGRPSEASSESMRVRAIVVSVPMVSDPSSEKNADGAVRAVAETQRGGLSRHSVAPYAAKVPS